LERIILITTDEGDLVLDPFVGTGTSGLAAQRLGRNYLGFELCPKYVQIHQLSSTSSTSLTFAGEGSVPDSRQPLSSHGLCSLRLPFT
jgi:hypothetical protein